MIIAVDARPLVTRQISGAEQHARNVVAQWAKMKTEHRFLLFFDKSARENFDDSLLADLPANFEEVLISSFHIPRFWMLGSRVLVHVVGLEPGDGHRRDPARREQRHMVGAEDGSLADRPALVADGMGEDRALGLAERHAAEYHAAASRAALPRLRSAPITSARIATAISAGDWAPILTPIGAWIRASASGPAPWPASRSSRLAWVFRLPSAPT